VSAASSTAAGNGSSTSVDAALEHVRAELSRPRGDRIPDIARLDAALASAGAQLRTAPADGAAGTPAQLASRVELVYDVTALQSELRARDLADRLDVLGRIKDSMAQLAELRSPEELIEAAPGELCWSCGFTRALVSQIRGSHWVPQVYEAVPGMDPEEDVFREWVENVEIPLEHMLLETELVRRRMPALVTDPEQHPRTFKDIVVKGRTAAYVVAPIIPAGRAIGFLHADRLGQDHEATPEDRDSIWTFAEHFGFVYHRAVLLERLEAQRAQLREAFGEAERLFDELRDAEIELGRNEPRAPELEPTALFLRSESRLDALLTRREREVLELITSGATNIRIAEQLVLSEGTVKSHVKHILRKLRVANRAEAVARYLQLMRRDQEQGAR
jgi:DNA-binding CsgD family transcriptional regulator